MHEHYALVPNSERTAVVVVDGRLPSVRSDERLRQPDIMAALTREHGIRATFLRTIRWRDDDGKRTTLFEVDDATAPPHMEWLGLDGLDPSTIVPDFADGVAAWVAEQRSGRVPPERAPWARPGWLPQAVAWVRRVVPSAGDPRLVRQWPLSAMYRFESDLGPLLLKACFTLWPQEPAVTALLAREHPGSVPDVVATDDDRGWLLMRELDGPDVADAEPDMYAAELRLLAELQQSWIDRAVTLPVPHRPLAQLREAAPQHEELCARLEAAGIPQTLTHGDVHQWNAKVVAGKVVLFDWSDAAVAHPFLDLGAALFYAEEAHDRDALIDAYLEPWGRGLREAATVGEALGCVYQALSFRAINAAFEEADRWLFAEEWERWTARANELAATL